MKKKNFQKQLKLKRTEIMILLYQYDFYFGDLKYINNDDKNKNFLIFKKIINQLTLIDEIIRKNLYNYTLERLNKIDKAIIRLATFELLEKKNIPEIIINEAIKLTKKYSELDDEKQHKFNNKILDQIYQNVKKENLSSEK